MIKYFDFSKIHLGMIWIESPNLFHFFQPKTFHKSCLKTKTEIHQTNRAVEILKLYLFKIYPFSSCEITGFFTG